MKALDDALFPVVGQMTGNDLAPHQKTLVDEVAKVVAEGLAARRHVFW